jgi:hypothetical protein
MNTQDKKYLGTIHTIGSIDEYYHVRTKINDSFNFKFVMVRNTRTGVREFELSNEQLPKQIKKSL